MTIIYDHRSTRNDEQLGSAKKYVCYTDRGAI